MDNRGNRLLVSDNDSAINMPAVGAAYAIKKYSALASDELSFEVCLFLPRFHMFDVGVISLIKITSDMFCKWYVCEVLFIKASSSYLIHLCLPLILQ